MDELANSSINSSATDDLLIAFDLRGYVVAKKANTSRYNPVVPYNTYTEMSKYEQPDRKRFNVERLPQTDVSDVLTGNYSQEAINPFKTLSASVPIESIAKIIESNVVAISIGKGEPLGTGLLIASNLILTARHCIEGIQLNKICIKEHYQSVSGCMDFGIAHEVLGIAESNDQLDYAILCLKNPVNNFRPINFDFRGEFRGESLFFHHPQGGPKKVSLHASVESNYLQLSHSSFHDSIKGSSGGVYANAEGDVFAMHMLHDGITTSARWMKDIREASDLLKNLYTRNGKIIGKSFRFTYQTGALPCSQLSQPYREWLERVDRPHALPNINLTPGAPPLTYHHIIPIGDMEFLWMLGKENPVIERFLRELSCDYPDMFDQGGLVINSVAWAPCNLFVGPTNRTDDPHQGDVKEKIKPNSFDARVWDALDLLYPAIQRCWDVRHRISMAIRHGALDERLSAFREQGIRTLDGSDGRGDLQELGIFGALNNPASNIDKLKKEYAQSQRELISRIKNVNSQINRRSRNHVHHTIAEDWVDSRHGRYQLATYSPSVQPH